MTTYSDDRREGQVAASHTSQQLVAPLWALPARNHRFSEGRRARYRPRRFVRGVRAKTDLTQRKSQHSAGEMAGNKIPSYPRGEGVYINKK